MIFFALGGKIICVRRGFVSPLEKNYIKVCQTKTCFDDNADEKEYEYLQFNTKLEKNDKVVNEIL